MGKQWSKSWLKICNWLWIKKFLVNINHLNLMIVGGTFDSCLDQRFETNLKILQKNWSSTQMSSINLVNGMWRKLQIYAARSWLDRWKSKYSELHALHHEGNRNWKIKTFDQTHFKQPSYGQGRNMV